MKIIVLSLIVSLFFLSSCFTDKYYIYQKDKSNNTREEYTLLDGSISPMIVGECPLAQEDLPDYVNAYLIREYQKAKGGNELNESLGRAIKISYNGKDMIYVTFLEGIFLVKEVKYACYSTFDRFTVDLNELRELENRFTMEYNDDIVTIINKM